MYYIHLKNIAIDTGLEYLSRYVSFPSVIGKTRVLNGSCGPLGRTADRSHAAKVACRFVPRSVTPSGKALAILLIYVSILRLLLKLGGLENRN